MRDNIKPIEARFFKYCMKRIDYSTVHFGSQIGTIETMHQMIVNFSKKYNIPIKVVDAIVNKWDGWFFEYGGDFGGLFDAYKFPAEYIMLIPRRTLRKCKVFGGIANEALYKKSVEYNTIFRYKTRINGLTDDEAIFENTENYWNGDYNIEKFEKAVLYINKELDKDDYESKLYYVLEYVKYIIRCYTISDIYRLEICMDAHRVNETARTIKRVMKYLEKFKIDAAIIDRLDYMYHDMLGEE